MGQNNSQSEKEQTTHERYTEVYIDFLNQYKKQLSNSMKTKNRLKVCFFVIIVLVMAVVVGLFVFSIKWSFDLISKDATTEVVTTSVVSIISSLVTVTVAIFKLPKIVASYLFNKKEDNLMKEVISTIQNYEINAIELEVKKLAKTVADSFCVESGDEIIEESQIGNDMELEDSPNAELREPRDRTEINEITEG